MYLRARVSVCAASGLDLACARMCVFLHQACACVHLRALLGRHAARKIIRDDMRTTGKDHSKKNEERRTKEGGRGRGRSAKRGERKEEKVPL